MLLLVASAHAGEVVFDPPKTVVSGLLAPSDLIAADVTGNGVPDLIVAQNDGVVGGIVYYPGTGSLTYLPEQLISVDGGQDIDVADVDWDGRLDVIGVSPLGDVAVFANTVGWPATPIATGFQRIAVGDVDRDGFIDVVTKGTSLAWYANDGGWSMSAIDSPFTTVGSIGVSDLDGDGWLDVVSGIEGANQVDWWANDGLWTRSSPIATSGAPGSTAQALTLGDVDGNGRVDVVLAGGSTELYEQNNGGAFVSTSLGGLATAARLGDLDLDGDVDIIRGDDVTATLDWFEQDGSNWAGRNISSAAVVKALAVADLDWDGDLDVAAVEGVSGDLHTFENRTIHRSALFQAPFATVTGFFLDELAAGDFDGDGDDDILAIHTDDLSSKLYVNNGSYALQTTILGGTPTHAAVGDIDGDGLVEAIYVRGGIGGQVHQVGWNGTGWATNKLFDVDDADTIAVGDFDIDGDVDIALGDLVNGLVRLFENDGGSWVEGTPFATGDPRVLAVADGDADGRAELIVGENDAVTIWEPDFSNPTMTDSLALARPANALVAFDAERDGDVDFAVGTGDGVSIFTHESTFGFFTRLDDPIGQVDAIEAGDIDLDGDLDLLVLNAVGSGELYDDGTGTFTFAGFDQDGGEDFFLSDLDRDGDLDRVVADDTLGWQLNTGGQYRLEAVAHPPETLGEDRWYWAMTLDVTHLGRAGDEDVRLSNLAIAITDGTGTAHPDNTIQDYFANVDLWEDGNGSGGFDLGDDLLTTFNGPMDDGVFNLPSGLVVAAGEPRELFLAFRTDADLTGLPALDVQIQIVDTTALHELSGPVLSPEDNGAGPSTTMTVGIDADNDGVLDNVDNCLGFFNPAQKDDDEDDYGDGCDCNDNDMGVNPGVVEAPGSCDGVDQDCSGTPPFDEVDDDLDSFTECEGDCDDGDDTIHPDADDDDCDGFDDDCDSQPDDDAADVDNDSYNACEDCDDADDTVNPGEGEVAGNAVDEDCSGDVDCWEDLDDDGVGGNLVSVASCAAAGVVAVDGDCDDNADTVYPGADEIVGDGIDQDCDDSDACYFDFDQDGFGNVSEPVGGSLGCQEPSESANGDDCDDGNELVFPGGTEICNAIDDDCDDDVDEGLDDCEPDVGDDDDDDDDDDGSVQGDDDDDGPVPDEEGHLGLYCGCASGGVGGWSALILALPIVLRRRR